VCRLRDMEDSRELLLKAAGMSLESWPSHNNEAKEAVDLPGSHTLALIHLHQYPKVYKRQRERLLRYRPRQAHSRYRDVYATFEASVDVLEKSGSESAKVYLSVAREIIKSRGTLKILTRRRCGELEDLPSWAPN
jgi:hypothetical protein